MNRKTVVLYKGSEAKTNSSVLKKWLFLIEIARPMFTLSRKEKVLFSFVLIAALQDSFPIRQTLLRSQQCRFCWGLFYRNILLIWSLF